MSKLHVLKIRSNNSSEYVKPCLASNSLTNTADFHLQEYWIYGPHTYLLWKYYGRLMYTNMSKDHMVFYSKSYPNLSLINYNFYLIWIPGLHYVWRNSKYLILSEIKFSLVRNHYFRDSLVDLQILIQRHCLIRPILDSWCFRKKFVIKLSVKIGSLNLNKWSMFFEKLVINCLNLNLYSYWYKDNERNRKCIKYWRSSIFKTMCWKIF